jgi:DNA mismatch repair protein MutS2
VTDPRNLKILEFDKIISKLESLTHTIPGKRICLELVPSSDPDIVTERLKETDDALKVIMTKSIPPLNGLEDISSPVTRADSGASLSCAELLQISKYLRGISRLISFAGKSTVEEENIVYSSIRKLVPVPFLENRISTAIAGEEDLYDNASVQLALIRRKIRDAQNEVKIQLDKMLKTYKDSLQEQIITMRGSRYVIPVRTDHRNDIKGIIHDTSSSGSTLFVEPLAIIEINNKVRELLSDERDETERILAELSGFVSDESAVLFGNLEITAYIDFIVAKGRLAVSMNAMCPSINDRGIIHMKNARHPLIPQDQVVPVTIKIGDDYRTLVITGPNTGGKTVSLKTCGLLTLMVMAGLMIPVSDNSQVSVFRNISADIGDEQSIEQSLSTFSSHMSKLVRMVDEAGPQTLMLVDELGSGTDPSEGAALAVAILEHFKFKGCITIATTHYKELKEYALITDEVENACCEFDVETLRPTYKLMIGVPGVSNAFAISAKLGLPKFIIERASGLLSGRDVSFEVVAKKTEEAFREAQKLRTEAEREFVKAKHITDTAKKDANEIEERKKKIFLESREKAREYADSVYDELRELISEVTEKAKSQNAEEQKKLLEEARIKVKTRRNRIEDDIGRVTIGRYNEGSPPEDLQEGKEYYSATLSISGILHEYSPTKNSCVLKSGNRTVSVPVASLREILPLNDKGHPIGRSTAPNDGFEGLSRKMNATTELKLLGYTADEAVMAMDKFIDDALISGLGSVRIVHGKGTGVLRNAVSSALRKDRRVKSFCLAGYGEGDSGVTIVEL